MEPKKRLRVGVIGGGGIAQMMHLPFLAKNTDRFEISALCDLSPKILSTIGTRFNIPEAMRFTNHFDLVNQDLDAVVITSGGDHAPQVKAALAAGKHVLVEKPICYSLNEVDEMTTLAAQKNLHVMVGYMKRYDPGYLFARKRLSEMGEIRYVQINTLHPEEEGYLRIHGLIAADDIPAAVMQEISNAQHQRVIEAVGAIAPYMQAEYTDVLLGSMIHDINAMRGLVGEPEKVLFAEHWPANEKPGGITATIQYPGALRAVYTWIFLPELRNYFQEIVVMSSTNRVRVQFPSPYLRNFPTPVIVESMKDGAAVEEKVIVSYDEAFEQELLAFYECVVSNHAPLTDLADARRDIVLLQQILAALHPDGLGGEAAAH